MKKFIQLFAIGVVLCLSSCYDDSALWDSVNDHETRIAKLETICNQMNTNISSLQAIVEALQESDYVIATAPIKENDKEIGYTIKFKSGKSITIYHGTNGKDGENGSDGIDGSTPVIGVKQDNDGLYYWTLNGDWLLDKEGNKIKAIGEDGENGKDAVSPKLKIENGYWYVSNDNGESWLQLGKAIDESARVFGSVECDETGLHLTLLDGTQITVPVIKELTLFLSTDSLECVKGKTYSVSYYISRVEESVKISVISEGGYTTTVSKTDETSGEIHIKVNENSINGKVLVFLTSGTQTIVQTVEIFLTDKEEILPETANCYIVSKAGTYSFPTVKGNSNTSVGIVASAEVLWESYGKSYAPNVGDLIKSVSYSNGYISYTTADIFREGNAVIAARSVSGEILWSWHIWFTDEPKEQAYLNNAGVVMDRNLGAISSIPGDAGALGLMYQWGRKDPFLGSSSITERVFAKSTKQWPSPVASSSDEGTIEYATEHPMTFITSNGDWCYDGDNTRWMSDKTMYDPCPVGWRVPDGGNTGLWTKAGFPSENQYDTNEGMKFNVANGETAWYPAAGLVRSSDAGIGSVAYSGMYWSVTLNANNSPYALYFSSYGDVMSSGYSNSKSFAFSVRCVKEDSESPIPSVPEYEAKNLSDDGTANSYIVSKSGAYKFSAVKGNSSESIGVVSSAEVLWETFGTDVTPNVGDMVKNVSYNNGEITFQTADTYKEGNAVIAAKDASGNILWSWHIWFTDEPEGQVYYNDAGTMMDRNLGATSATPGDVGALGLLYQWGRKDPFLGSSSISNAVEAKSTIIWPSTVSSTSSNGTIAYATAHPTTFITPNTNNYDWYYTGAFSTDNTRWTTSETSKSVYDPCPLGWRVPDGGSSGIWSKASFDDATYSRNNKGISFSISSPLTTWYPASGYRYYDDGSLSDVSDCGRYWSCSPNSSCSAYYLYIKDSGGVDPNGMDKRAYAYSVRCIQE